jgi:hypothetical protein
MNVAKSSFNYDMCFVFPTDPKTSGLSSEGEELLRKLTPLIGQENMHLYFSVDKGEIYCLVRLSDERAKYYAAMNVFCLFVSSMFTFQKGDSFKC